VEIENIGSKQIQKCRKALGESSIILIGKNTMIKKLVEKKSKEKSQLINLLPYIDGKVGLIFTDKEVYDVREILIKNSIPAPAKIGQLAQCDVIIPAGPTGITPDGTSFFQALDIPTKIQKGQIEIQNDIKILSKGSSIGESEVSLLNKLGIVPFTYELQIKAIFQDGACYFPSVFDLTKDKIENRMNECLENFQIISFSINHLNKSSVFSKIKKVYSELYYIACNTTYWNELVKKKILETKLAPHSSPLGNCKLEKEDTENSIDSIKSETGDEDNFGLNLFD
jgi:large subunit ribosomal protein LP0